MIRRGPETKEPVFDYLSGVFRCDKEKISEYVDIHQKELVLKEVDHMTGLGLTIMQEAMQQGLEKGIEKGIKQGIEQGIEKGETLLASLVVCLKRDGRLNELDHIVEEKTRKRLYKEYGLPGSKE